MTKKTLERKGFSFFYLTYIVSQPLDISHGRNSGQASIRRQKPRKRSWRNVAY